MKVKELIEELQKYGPDRELKIVAEGNYWDIIGISDDGKCIAIESND